MNDAIARMTPAMVTDVASGERVVVLRTEEEVTPAQAAALLGVTRQFVDRLCEDQILPFRRLPGSRHRRIRVQDVIEVAAEREHRRAGHDALRTGIEDAGLLDEWERVIVERGERMEASARSVTEGRRYSTTSVRRRAAWSRRLDRPVRVGSAVARIRPTDCSSAVYGEHPLVVLAAEVVAAVEGSKVGSRRS